MKVSNDGTTLPSIYHITSEQEVKCNHVVKQHFEIIVCSVNDHVLICLAKMVTDIDHVEKIEASCVLNIILTFEK